MPPKRSTPRWRMLLNRTLVAALGCGLLWFAVEGGEYGTRELFHQRSYHKALLQEVELLQRDVDSLQKEKTAIRTNDAVLERIAREQYGMLKGNKEILFWTNNTRADGDSAPARGTLSGR
ncbi:MAG: septum formation initiator family protein [Gemmatimonas sp.]